MRELVLRHIFQCIHFNKFFNIKSNLLKIAEIWIQFIKRQTFFYFEIVSTDNIGVEYVRGTTQKEYVRMNVFLIFHTALRI